MPLINSEKQKIQGGKFCQGHLIQTTFQNYQKSWHGKWIAMMVKKMIR